MMTVEAPTRISGVVVGSRVAWLDPNGTEARGTVVSVDDAGLVVNEDRVGQTRLRWSTPGLRLLGEAAAPETAAEGEDYATWHNERQELLEIPISQIDLNPRNPRQISENEDAELAALAENIKQIGLSSPITVRETGDEQRPYEVVAGERRFLACVRAGLTSIRALNKGRKPAEQAFAETLSENAFRVDLNPIEEARAIEQGINEFGWTQEQVGKLLGNKDQSWVSHTRSLLRLPAEAQEFIRHHKLKRSHAEELLRLVRWPQDLVKLARAAAEGEWSVSVLAEKVRERKRQLEARDQPGMFAPEEIDGPSLNEQPTPRGQAVIDRLVDAGVEEGLVDPEEAEELKRPSAPAQSDSAGAITTAPASDRNAPIKTAAEIAAERAEERATAPAPPKKSGVLMSAEEKVQQRAAQTAATPAPAAPALPEGWEGKPVVAIIPAELAKRLQDCGGAPVPEAVATYCELAAMAAKHGLMPERALDHLGTILVCATQPRTTAQELIDLVIAIRQEREAAANG